MKKTSKDIVLLLKDYPLEYANSLRRIALSEVPVMAIIPYDINVLKSLAETTPFTSFRPKSEGSQEYRKLAATLVGEKYEPVKLKSFFRWIAPRKQDINRTIFYERVFN